MSDTVQSRLAELGIVLPVPAPPQANYIPTIVSGGLIFVSGQVSIGTDGRKFIGKVGADFSVEEGREAARIAAINILANLNAAVGDLERIVRMVKVVGFVNCTPNFDEPHKVINGASDLVAEVLGERGRHTRSAVGVAQLPFGAAVEVEAIAEIA